MGRRWWLPAVRLALAESLYAAASTDTSTSQNRLREEALKQSIKHTQPFTRRILAMLSFQPLSDGS